MQPWIEPLSPEPVSHTLPAISMGWYNKDLKLKNTQ